MRGQQFASTGPTRGAKPRRDAWWWFCPPSFAQGCEELSNLFDEDWGNNLGGNGRCFQYEANLEATGNPKRIRLTAPLGGPNLTKVTWAAAIPPKKQARSKQTSQTGVLLRLDLDPAVQSFLVGVKFTSVFGYLTAIDCDEKKGFH